jgi:nitrate/nitrite-specific signal transduction histidine kinase
MAREHISLGDQDFDIVAEQPGSEALSSALNNIYLTAGITLAAMVLAGFLGIMAARQITNPIGELAETAQRISEGDLTSVPTVTSQDEIGSLATAFSDMTTQLRRTLENLEQRVAERTKALATSAEVSRRLATILDPGQLVGEVVNEVRNAFDYYYAQIYLLDEAGENLVIAGGTGEAGASMLASRHMVPKGRGLVGRAADTNTSVLVGDTLNEEGWLPNELLPDTKAEAAIPIAVGEQVLGVLDVQHNLVNGLTDEDVILLESLAGQVAISLQNARSYEQSRKQAELEGRVNVISQKIQRTTTIEDTLQTAIRELGMAIGASRVKASLGSAPKDVATEPVRQTEPDIAIEAERNNGSSDSDYTTAE